jgi:hypothetical protein
VPFLIGCPRRFMLLPAPPVPGDLTVSKRTGTSNRIEIQFRTFKHLPHPDSFVKLFETLCLCLAQGNKYLGQIWDRNLIPLMRYWVILNQKWISILQLVPGLFRVPRSPSKCHEPQRESTMQQSQRRLLWRLRHNNPSCQAGSLIFFKKCKI